MSDWTPQLSSLVTRNNKQVREMLKDLEEKDMGFVGRKTGTNHIYVKHATLPNITALFSTTTSDQRAYPRQKRDIAHMIAKVQQAS